MVLYFSGTGNSRYIAKRIAEALEDDIIDLNARIKARDTSSIQTGQDVILVTPTYAWRIEETFSPFPVLLYRKCSLTVKFCTFIF